MTGNKMADIYSNKNPYSMHASYLSPSIKTPFNNYVREVKSGTEYMASEFQKRVLPHMKNLGKYQCVVAPGRIESVDKFLSGDPIIIWLHVQLDQIGDNGLEFFRDKKFQDKIKYIVAVSDRHKQKTIEQCGIDPDKIVVIPNAIEEISFNKNKFKSVDKVKIIHASQPERGMEILLMAATQIDDDFELNIFNSFNPDIDQITPAMEELLKTDNRINFFARTPHKTVLKFFSEAHIHAYPSVFEETFCISQIEALASGTYSLYSNLGALKETSLGYGKMIELSKNGAEEYASNYAKELSSLIKSIKNESLTFDPEAQAKDIASTYSWDNVIKKWIELDGKL